MGRKFQFDHPDDALRGLAAKLTTTGIDRCAEGLPGRILAAPVTADRDSPAADVSAMDGYAIRMEQLRQNETIPIGAESSPGAPPPELPPDSAVRIFTGAIVPCNSEVVVKREDTEELDGAIRLRDSARSLKSGEHIRRAGENAKAGSTVLKAGMRITAAQQATMANFGHDAVDVFAPVRVSIVTTGDEVGRFDRQPPQPWQLRNSNRQSLCALLSRAPHVEVAHVDHCIDDRNALYDLLQSRLEDTDAILLTGGVSMGNYDYVPDVIADVGGDIVFHGLPLRPGKPILGAATGGGKLMMGLPGNPVSATIGCYRMAMPLLSKLGGQTDWLPKCAEVRLSGIGPQTIPLHWLRLVRLVQHGVAEVVVSQGSGDLVSLGQSTGFVETAPNTADEGPWPYYHWP